MICQANRFAASAMSPNGAMVSVLYPHNVDSTFELEYYLPKHMLLVAKLWTKYGLPYWSVAQLSVDAPYRIHTLMEWDSMEAFEMAS